VAAFLINDHAMALAKVIAGMLNLNAEEHKEAFCKICKACKASFVIYEEKSDRMYRRVKPSSN